MERAKQVTMTDLNAAIGVRQPSAHPSPPPLARGAPIPQAMVTSALSPIPWAGDLSCPEPTGVGCSPLPLLPAHPWLSQGEEEGKSDWFGGLLAVLGVEEMLLLQRCQQGGGWCMSLCPATLWPGGRVGVTTIPTPLLFPPDHGTVDGYG